VYATAAQLPAAPDLAVLCTPAATVPGLVAELGALGTRAAIVVTAGLGRLLSEQLIEHARSRGIGRLVGIVLRENTRMLKLAHDLGFTEDRTAPQDPGTRRLVKALDDRGNDR